MFCDKCEVTLGDEAVTVRRATLDELEKAHPAVWAFVFKVQQCTHPAVRKFVAEHCATSNGKPLKCGGLSFAQMEQLSHVIGHVPQGAPFADFIGLLL